MDTIVLVLDAMGVIYEAADDVAELLEPFIVQNGGTRKSETVQELYTAASLGKIDAKEFWRGVSVDPDVEGVARYSASSPNQRNASGKAYKGVVLWS